MDRARQFGKAIEGRYQNFLRTFESQNCQNLITLEFPLSIFYRYPATFHPDQLLKVPLEAVMWATRLLAHINLTVVTGNSIGKSCFQFRFYFTNYKEFFFVR